MWSRCRCDRTTKSRLVRLTFFALTFAASIAAISTSAEKPQSFRIEASLPNASQRIVIRFSGPPAADCGGRHQHARDCACQKQLHELCHYKFLLLLHAKSFWLAGTNIIKFCTHKFGLQF